MKKILIAIAACFCAMNVFAQGPTYEELLENDWARLGSYAPDNEALNGNSPDMVLMGNSITWGWERQRPDFFTGNNFAGRGISGQTTIEMLVRFRPDVLNLRPKYVAILAGTNDIAMNNGYISLENILGNIVSMCELARFNGIQVLLCSVAPCAAYGWRPQVDGAKLVPELNAMLKEYADAAEGVTYVDYFSALADDNNALPEEYSPDGCHPNEAGYLIMEKVLVEALNGLAGTEKYQIY